VAEAFAALAAKAATLAAGRRARVAQLGEAFEAPLKEAVGVKAGRGERSGGPADRGGSAGHGSGDVHRGVWCTGGLSSHTGLGAAPHIGMTRWAGIRAGCATLHTAQLLLEWLGRKRLHVLCTPWWVSTRV
jgi:hypothetical protein